MDSDSSQGIGTMLENNKSSGCQGSLQYSSLLYRSDSLSPNGASTLDAPQSRWLISPSLIDTPSTLRRNPSLPSLLVHRLSSEPPGSFSPYTPQSNDPPSAFQELVDEQEDEDTGIDSSYDISFNEGKGPISFESALDIETPGIDRVNGVLPRERWHDDVCIEECSDVGLLDF